MLHLTIAPSHHRTALAPTVGQLLAELISFQSVGSDLQIRKSHKDTTFGEASADAESFGIAIAVIPVDGELAFAPNDSHHISKNDDILFIAHKTSGDKFGDKDNGHPNSLSRQGGRSSMDSTDVVPDGISPAKLQSKGHGKRIGSLVPKETHGGREWLGEGAYRYQPTTANHRQRSTNSLCTPSHPNPIPAAVVVVLGWRQSVEMIMLLSSLDDRLPPG